MQEKIFGIVLLLMIIAFASGCYLYIKNGDL